VDLSEIHRATAAGLAPLKVNPPERMAIWGSKHFYLSSESSQVEQRWSPWPFQSFIMDCMGSDEVEEFALAKAARVGYTKILLCAIAYFAVKRRNQIIYQPTDDDSDEFVKTEFEPVAADMPALKAVFPSFMAKHKDNTLRQKRMLGCMLHFRGGTAAKNYRRLTAGVVNMDEITQFPSNVDGQGSPVRLAKKRLEGATFPKFNNGSTCGILGYCLISMLVEASDEVFTPQIPCPHCGEFHPLTFGGRDESHGFKWQSYVDEHGADRLHVTHLCPHCAAHYTQQEYFSVWKRTEWRSERGLRATPDFKFQRIADGAYVPTPKRIGARGLWTAYSEQATWESIAEEYIAAARKQKQGDDSLMRSFVNLTAGRPFEIKSTQADAHALATRAEDYALRTVPMGALRITAGVDIQDNRFHVCVWAFGRGEEMWLIDRVVFSANPADERDWEKLALYLFETTFTHAAGTKLKIEATAVDTGGHFTHEVYRFCAKYSARRVYAIRGDTKYGMPIKGKGTSVDVNYKGKVAKKGVKLHHVGTDTAKDLMYSRLQLRQAGPGFVHFPKFEDLNDFLDQLTAEKRIPKRTARGEQWVWDCPAGKRNEDCDATNYALFAAHSLDINKFSDRMWDKYEALVQPPTGELFDQIPAAQTQPVSEQIAAKPVVSKPQTNNEFASDAWLSRM
jgi:phage terminase large subunit GpA-like protein